MRFVALVFLLVAAACSSAPRSARVGAARQPHTDDPAVQQALAILSAFERQRWEDLVSRVDTTDFLIFLRADTLAKVAYVRDTAVLRAFFPGKPPAGGFKPAEWRATPPGHVRIVAVRLIDGPAPGWWSFSLIQRRDSWKAFIIDASGEAWLSPALRPLLIGRANEELKLPAPASEAAGSLRSPAALLMVRRSLTPAR